MKKQKTYLRLTLVLSVLFGIILPLALGVKDPTLIAITFSFVWFVYVAIFLIYTFLIAGRRNLKKRLEELINDRWGFS
jgi:CBS domain containing-hemolysin-like protein